MNSKWNNVLAALALGTILLLIGSVFFYWGAWYPLHGYGTPTPGIERVVMVCGVFIIIGGIFISSYLGKTLRSKYLATISLLHLVIAPSLIYFVFSILDPHYVHIFIPPMILSNIALDIAFLLGYFIRRLSSQLQTR